MQLVAADIPLECVSPFFLTHHHYDHFADLADVILTSWLLARQQPLPLLGPPRTKAIVTALHNTYTDLVPGTLHKRGGKILARGGKFETVEGPETFHRFVLIEFPSFEKAVACHEPAEYLEAAAHRKKTVRPT